MQLRWNCYKLNNIIYETIVGGSLMFHKDLEDFSVFDLLSSLYFSLTAQKILQYTTIKSFEIFIIDTSKKNSKIPNGYRNLRNSILDEGIDR